MVLNVVKRTVLCGSILIQAMPAVAFVLLSGPEEAKLIATTEVPTIYFAVSDKIPNIKGKESFLGGKYADLSDEDFWHALIVEAMKPWNDISSAFIDLQLDNADEAASDEKDRIHSITVDSVNATSAAFASPQMEDGDIIDCDITVSSKSVDAKSLAYTMMHELGHCLGLGHNHTNYDSVMGYSRDNENLRLSLDDKMGVTYLYPGNDVGSSRETLGCGVVGSSSNLERIGSLLVLLLPIMILAPAVYRRFKLG